jgi:DNA-binding CsgD family transcriptional regulator
LEGDVSSPTLPHDAKAHASTSELSRSELDVLEDAANGLTTRQSAANRSKSPETVKSQRTSVLTKLGARNIVQAVAITVREREVVSECGGGMRFA